MRRDLTRDVRVQVPSRVVVSDSDSESESRVVGVLVLVLLHDSPTWTSILPPPSATSPLHKIRYHPSILRHPMTFGIYLIALVDFPLLCHRDKDVASRCSSTHLYRATFGKTESRSATKSPRICPDDTDMSKRALHSRINNGRRKVLKSYTTESLELST